MTPIEFTELKKGMVIMEECSYGNNIFKVTSDYHIKNNPEEGYENFGAVDVIRMEDGHPDIIGGIPGWEPKVYLISHN